MRSHLLALLVAFALAALASGCGGTVRPASPATATVAPPASTTTASVDPAVAATGSPAPTAAAEQPVASTAAIPTAALPRVRFERSDGTAVTLPVEVPPRDQYAIGLSGRETVADRGMVFYYPGGIGNAGFWMSHTYVDLAIAFVTTAGVISEIHEMTAESLVITRPATPYEFAIEAPAGWYAAHDVVAGDRMRLEFDVTDYVD